VKGNTQGFPTAWAGASGCDTTVHVPGAAVVLVVVSFVVVPFVHGVIVVDDDVGQGDDDELIGGYVAGVVAGKSNLVLNSPWQQVAC